MRRRLILIAVGAVVLLLATVLYLSLYRIEGYFAPIFSDDGRSVYFVQRDTTGFVWGLGWEFFTPPAHSWALSDAVSIRRLELETGELSILQSWPSTPVTRRHLREYRGRAFQILSARLGLDDAGNLHYALDLNVTRIPTSELNALNGSIRLDGGPNQAANWQQGYPRLGAREGRVLHDRWEAMTVPGSEAYPAAMVIFDGKAAEARVLLSNSEFDSLYPKGVPLELMKQNSRRADIERIEEIERVNRELVAKFRAEGASEGDAMLRASKEMQRLGFYPKSPTFTARLMAHGEPLDPAIPAFDIEPMQFTVGLFPDIERAIATPGTEVEKDWTGYIIHDDYDTSQKLNAFLETGAARFYIRYDNQIFEITIDRP